MGGGNFLAEKFLYENFFLDVIVRICEHSFATPSSLRTPRVADREVANREAGGGNPLLSSEAQ